MDSFICNKYSKVMDFMLPSQELYSHRCLHVEFSFSLYTKILVWLFLHFIQISTECHLHRNPSMTHIIECWCEHPERQLHITFYTLILFIFSFLIILISNSMLYITMFCNGFLFVCSCSLNASAPRIEALLTSLFPGPGTVFSWW